MYKGFNTRVPLDRIGSWQAHSDLDAPTESSMTNER
jgi:hypothetical protein